ncbi:MAG: apolipoprotein A1/A4/E family protein [Oscillospiraceae bacterium]|nr:apolipoprotein A1/A4/E family protein [Oscillospiraceae bacterium]
MKKRTIALALSVLMLLSLIPQQTSAEMIILPFPDDDNSSMIIKPWYPNADSGYGYNSKISGEAIFSAMMEQAESGKAPDSFNDDTLTPYGTQKNEAFTILEKAEIFEYISYDGITKVSAFHDDLKEHNYAVKGSITDMLNSNDAGSIPGGLRFARGVAFDPTGSGRRDHVAIVGFSYDGTKKDYQGKDSPVASFHLYIVNAETKKTVNHMTFSSGSDFRYGDFISKLTVVDSGNFVQITAGDYNGDGRDSLVFYDGIGMYEVSCANSAYSSKRIYGGANGLSYLHPDHSKYKLGASWQVENQLCMALASGDVNGDGIDDLVALSYTGDISSTYVSTAGNATCIPNLSVGYGKKGASGVSALSVDKASVGTKQSNGTTTNTLACPGVAVGDIDGDGKNEIIAAGYKNQSKPTDVIIVDDSKNANTVAYIYYKTSGAGALKSVGNIRELKRAETSPIAKDDSLREPEQLFQQLSVECVALEGMHTQEYVFLSGWFYCLDDAGNLQSIASNTIERYQTGENRDFPNLFTDVMNDDFNIDGKDVDEVFIHSASVGNVFGSATGKEAILLVVGYKTHTDANKEGSYHYKEVVYYHRARTSANDMKTETVWFSTLGELDRAMKKMTAEGSALVSCSRGGPNVLLIAVDYGTDSVVGRYSGKAYAYTDPTPVAFLQAAPYFSELGAENSSTQYSYSEGYRVTSGTSEEVSYNVGFASEVEAGAVKASMEVGLAYELNQEFTKSIDKTFTTTFEANDQNQVILRQTLMYYYYYDVQVYKDGKYEFLPSALIVSAPQYPVLTSLSMDQYNDFATAYNKAVAASTGSKVDKAHKMDLITDALKSKYFLNNEGNPFAYASSAAAYTYNGIPGWDLSQAKVGDTDTWMKLSYAGGTQTQTYSVTLEEEKTKSVAEGGYANMSLMVGGGSDILNVSAYAGITAEYERLKGSSISTASMTSTETSGTVQNLSPDLTDYGFNWKLIGWKTDDLFPGVPFVGYAVKDQKDLPKPVDDLKASYSNGKVTLTFTAPSADPGRMQTTHFYAYDDLHDRYIGACSNNYGPNGDNVERSITIDVSGYSATGATFTVIPYREDPMMGGIGGTRGMPSNEVFCLFAMSDKEVKALIQELKDKIADLTEALEEQGSDYEAKLAELIEAYKAADEALKSQVDQEQEAARKALSDAMAEADKALKEAIDKVNADLSAAIAKLRTDTEADLEKAITDLTNAYLSADALLKADIDDLSDKLDALKQTMIEADDALLAAVEQVKADLDAAKKDLESAIAEEVEQLNSKINTLNSALEAAFKLADEMLKRDIDGLSQRLDELEAKHKEDIDALRAELEAKHKEDVDALHAELDALKAQIAKQDEINSTAIQTLNNVDSTQQEKLDTTRIIAIIGLCIGIVSLLGNGALLFSLLKKKSLTKF